MYYIPSWTFPSTASLVRLHVSMCGPSINKSIPFWETIKFPSLFYSSPIHPWVSISELIVANSISYFPEASYELSPWAAPIQAQFTISFLLRPNAPFPRIFTQNRIIYSAFTSSDEKLISPTDVISFRKGLHSDLNRVNYETLLELIRWRCNEIRFNFAKCISIW